MSGHQIFISYAREDREAAQRLAKALERDGWSMWWDRKLIAGTSFDAAIDAALMSAACVVVLWSGTSVASDWVKNEATEGLKRRVLVPVLLENVRIPLQFRHLQSVDLGGWSGEADHPEYENLLQAVRELTTAATSATGSLDSSSVATKTGTKLHDPATAARPTHSRRRVLAAVGAALVAAGGGVAWTYGRKSSTSVVLESELEQLRNACHALSRKLGAQQESDGAYKANPYDGSVSFHVTAQVLYGLFASVQSGSGDFGAEPSARGAQALCGLAKDVWPCDSPEKPPSNVEQRTVPAAWAALALTRYLGMYDDSASSLALSHLRKVLLDWVVENGSFQFSCDPANRNHANAYATVLALMALVECRRTLGADDATERVLTRAAEWLAKTFPSPSTGAEVALQAVNGLAAQAFWALEQARKGSRERQRTPAEEHVAALLFRDLLKQCQKAASQEGSCTATDGKIPAGLGSQSPLIMLWLPWSTLAAIELVRTPPQNAKRAELDAMRAATRNLVTRLTARGDMNVDSFRYEPAEVLCAMAEALRVLGSNGTGA